MMSNHYGFPLAFFLEPNYQNSEDDLLLLYWLITTYVWNQQDILIFIWPTCCPRTQTHCSSTPECWGHRQCLQGPLALASNWHAQWWSHLLHEAWEKLPICFCFTFHLRDFSTLWPCPANSGPGLYPAPVGRSFPHKHSSYTSPIVLSAHKALHISYIHPCRIIAFRKPSFICLWLFWA